MGEVLAVNQRFLTQEIECKELSDGTGNESVERNISAKSFYYALIRGGGILNSRGGQK